MERSPVNTSGWNLQKNNLLVPPSMPRYVQDAEQSARMGVHKSSLKEMAHQMGCSCAQCKSQMRTTAQWTKTMLEAPQTVEQIIVDARYGLLAMSILSVIKKPHIDI